MKSKSTYGEPVIGPPPRSALWGEAFGLLEPFRLLYRMPALASGRRGTGQPVLVLPGFGATDRSTWILRRYLRYLGHSVEGWGLGRNHGHVPQLIPRVVRRLSEMHAAYQKPVALVGWSLGGYLAREAARERPEEVDRVITLGSPVIGGPKYTAAHTHYLRKGYDLDEIEARVAERDRIPLRVPVTAIYSQRDGIVAWQACIDRSNEATEHVEVGATHVGLGLSPDVLAIIAERLGAAT